MAENTVHLNDDGPLDSATKLDGSKPENLSISTLGPAIAAAAPSSSSAPASTTTSSASSSTSPSPPPMGLGPSPVIVPSASFTPTLSPIPSNGPATLPPASLPAPVASKPRSRSNSTLQSSRPAPASPVPSRPPSQLVNRSPGGRDRAGSGASVSSSQRGSALASASSTTPGSASTSSSAAGILPAGLGLSGRRASLSGSTSSGLRSASLSRPRNRSSLGATSVVPDASSVSSSSSHLQDQTQPGTSTIDTTSSQPSAAISLDNATPVVPPPITPTTPVPRKLTIIVRDYAFQPPDPRHLGLGPDRPLSNWGDATPPPPPPDTPSEDKKQPAWGGFGLLGLRGFLGRRRASERSGGGRSGGGASNDDDEFNNNGEDDYSLPVPDHDDDDYAFYSGSEVDETDEPFGLFRAAYAFEAEGENELTLAEGEIVDVRGRGVGEGWVVAVKIVNGVAGGKEGLVPEGYLERHYGGAGTVTPSASEGAEGSGTGSGVALAEDPSVEIVVDDQETEKKPEEG